MCGLYYTAHKITPKNVTMKKLIGEKLRVQTADVSHTHVTHVKKLCACV